MIELIGVSLRVVGTDGYTETRDAISHDWLRFFSQYEVVPLLIPNVPSGSLALLEIMEVSSLLLVGGNDVAPLDEDEGMLHIDGVSRERDITEHAMIEHAVRERLPLLGVCRGMQMLNTYFGGEIVRDVSAICGHPEAHVAVSHTVDFIDAKYQRQFGTSIAQTNSFHRQAVTSSTLAAELRPFAVARDGIVEGIYHPELPIVGIQWHPERAKSPVKVDRILIDNWLGRR